MKGGQDALSLSFPSQQEKISYPGWYLVPIIKVIKNPYRKAGVFNYLPTKLLVADLTELTSS